MNEVILKKYKSNIINYKIAYLVIIIFCEYFNVKSKKLMNQKNIEFILYNNMNKLMKNNNINELMKNNNELMKNNNELIKNNNMNELIKNNMNYITKNNINEIINIQSLKF